MTKRFKRNKAAEEQVIAYDAKVHTGMNRTRFYTWLGVNASSPHIDVVTYAVKKGKRGQAHAKAVIRANIGTDKFYARDVIYHYRGGYMADWSPEGFYKPPEWSGNGKWFEDAYTAGSTMWKLNRPVVNLADLQNHATLKYCAYNAKCGNIYDYLRAYAAHPRIEILVKLGLEHHALCSGFVSRLERDKAFMSFVGKHVAEIKECRYGVDVINKAYKLGCSFVEASRIVEAIRTVARTGRSVPKFIDRMKIVDYVNKNSTTVYDYARYAANCAELGLDMADTKNAFPKQFTKRSKYVAREVESIRMMKEVEHAEEVARNLSSIAQKYLALERARGKFACVLPRTFKDFLREGEAMNHCVGSPTYAENVAAGKSLIVFARMAANKNSHVATIEIDQHAGKVLQCYGKNNSKPADEVLSAANKIASMAKRICSRRMSA